ncbi:hypothetical protein FACS1894187_00730 [Synergistales bacterium]|nr:hypothetical protein FACS1894187_00730 [Synergistales bacterium]
MGTDNGVNLSTEVKIKSAGDAEMKNREEILEVIRLHNLGWGTRRIAGELEISRETAKKYIRNGGRVEYKKACVCGVLSEHSDAAFRIASVSTTNFNPEHWNARCTFTKRR